MRGNAAGGCASTAPEKRTSPKLVIKPTTAKVRRALIIGVRHPSTTRSTADGTLNRSSGLSTVLCLSEFRKMDMQSWLEKAESALQAV